MTRRALLAFVLVLALVLASLLAGCVEIKNPQFDARYETAERTNAVFAVWKYGAGVSRPIGSPRLTELVVVDVARPSSAVTVPIAGASAVSDVQLVDGRPRVLLAEDERIAEADLLTRRISMVASGPPLANTSALGAAYDDAGGLVSWYESLGDMRFTVRRRDAMARERQASVSLLDLFSAMAPVARWRSTWRASDMMFLAGDEHYAYFVSTSPLPWDVSLPRTTVWRADFVSGHVTEVKLGGVHRFPLILQPPRQTHADRAMRRFGIPVQGVPDQVVFLSLTGGVREASALPTSPAGMVVQPGGERYLTGTSADTSYLSTGTVRIALASFGQTSTEVLLERPAVHAYGVGLQPVGLVNSVLAYSGVIRPRQYPSGPGPDVQLRLYDTRTRKDSAVTTARGAGGAVVFDYLGSYAR